jgi:RNA polymerase sigma-70 factor (ECF subfamily)
MGPTEDARLVGLARRGVASAFDELFRMHSRRVHDLAYSLLGDRDGADDVVQEVFVRVHRRLGSFRGQCSLRGWILRITVNECVSQRRRVQRQNRQRQELQAAAVGLRATRDRRMEYAQAARQALQTLRPVDRALVVMRDVQGYTYEEIGEVLGSSSNSVRVRLHRARKALRRELERLLAEEADQ